jgi:hypothetical protein
VKNCTGAIWHVRADPRALNPRGRKFSISPEDPV